LAGFFSLWAETKRGLPSSRQPNGTPIPAGLDRDQGKDETNVIRWQSTTRRTSNDAPIAIIHCFLCLPFANERNVAGLS
jgi:hypothetical protein